MFLFYYKMILNTKYRNLTNNKIVRSSHGLYPATITLLVLIPVYDPHPPLYRVSYATDIDLIFQMLNLIFLIFVKLHCLCTILYQSSPLIICIVGGKVIWTENQIKEWLWYKGWKRCQSFCISLPLLVLQPCLQFIPMPPCSCLPCEISVGKNVFMFGCDCGLPPVNVQTSGYQ